MKNELTKLSDEEKKNIEGGFNPLLLTTLVPLGISVFNSLVGGIKTLTSSNGEFKTNDSHVKWKESEQKPFNPF